MEIHLNRFHARNTKKRDKHLWVVINIYFNNKRKLSSESVIKDKAKTEGKKKKILNRVKTLKETLFHKFETCFLEAATETCSGKWVLWNSNSNLIKVQALLRNILFVRIFSNILPGSFIWQISEQLFSEQYYFIFLRMPFTWKTFTDCFRFSGMKNILLKLCLQYAVFQ